jgi:gluconolactonase
MNTRRRLALVIVALPLAFYGYACSSDSTDGTTGEDAGGGSETGPKPGVDSSVETDSSTGKDGSTADSSMPDAADGAVPITCIGNPLTADGGNLDGGVNLDAAVTTKIIEVAAGNFLDGPTWFDANGGFLVYSQFDQTEGLFRSAADGGANRPFRDSGLDNNNGPVGNAVRSGLLVTAVNAKTGVGVPKFLLTAADGGAAGTLSVGDAGSNSPNDLVVGPANNIYFTDGQYQPGGQPGITGLYRILGTDAGVQAIQQNFGRANGIAISPDNTKLYVGIGPINAGDPDKKKVLVYDVAATGVVTAPVNNVFLTDTDLADVPDGMAVDVGGNLWIAEAALDGSANGRIEVFSSAKKKLGTIPMPGFRPTGVAFGGTDSKTLFITTEASTSGGAAPGVFTYVSRCAGVR